MSLKMVRKQNTEYETKGREHAEKSLAKANNFCSKLTNNWHWQLLRVRIFGTLKEFRKFFGEVKIRILQALKKNPESVIFSDFFFLFQFYYFLKWHDSLFLSLVNKFTFITFSQVSYCNCVLSFYALLHQSICLEKKAIFFLHVFHTFFFEFFSSTSMHRLWKISRLGMRGLLRWPRWRPRQHGLLRYLYFSCS